MRIFNPGTRNANIRAEETHRFTRRDLIRFVAAGAVSSCAGREAHAQPSPRTQAASVDRGPFADAILIDGLGTIGGAEWDLERGDALSAKDIEDVRQSGVTAINITVDDITNDEHAFEHTIATLAILQREVAAHPEALCIIRNGAELRAAKASKRTGLIFGFQGATALGPELEHFDTFYGLGVRIMQLTYNIRNLLGDGCLEPGNAGLSALGRRAVERMNASKVLIDVSHSGRRTTDEAIEQSKRPIVISHTGCAALYEHPRNKTDEQLKRCADKGGVIGIYFMPFLRPQGQQMASDVIAHIEHAVQVCGEDHVSIGTDGTISPLDITPNSYYVREHRKFVEERHKKGIAAPGEDPNIYFLCPDLNAPRRFQMLGEKLVARGHSEMRVKKILGGNFARVFSDVCG